MSCTDDTETPQNYLTVIFHGIEVPSVYKDTFLGCLIAICALTVGVLPTSSLVTH